MKHDAAKLEKIIRDADREKCVEFFLGSNKEERAGMRMLVEKMTPIVLEQDKESFHAMIHSNPGGKSDDRRKTVERCRILGLCVLATGTLPQMKRLDGLCDPFDQPEMLCKLLENLQVPWLGDWVEYLAEERKQARYQCLIEAKLSPAPVKNVEGYTLGLLDRWNSHRADFCAEDSEFLRSQVWNFFKYEGSDDQSLAAYDKFSKGAEATWAFRLKKAAEEEKISRARLLDESLDTLARDFAQFRAGWFSRFHEYMEPTVAERVERKDRYLILLASTIPPTVSFALKALKIIDGAGRLPSSDLVPYLPPVLLAKHKGTVLMAVGLLEAVAAREPKQRPDVLRVAIEGLISDVIQVQERLVKLLAKYSTDIDTGAKKRLSELMDQLAPSSAKKIGALLPDVRPALVAEPEIEVTVPASPLEPSRRIAPIADMEELIERAAYLLENSGDLLEAERVLDGLVRFPVTGSENPGKKAQPLFKRADKICAAKQRGAWELQKQVVWMLGLMVRNWIEPRNKAELLEMIAKGEFAINFSATHYNQGFRGYFLRLNAVLKQILDQETLPLLCTPTHEDFLIEPGTLVTRITAWNEKKREPDIYDAVTALLRLGSSGREEARKAARGLTGELGQAVRYALGMVEKIGENLPLWIAAGRARYGGQDDPQLRAKHPNLGPGAAEMPGFEWKPLVGEKTVKLGASVALPELARNQPQEYTFMVYELTRAVPVAMPPEVPISHLPVVLHNDYLLFKTKWGNRIASHWGMDAYAMKYYLSAWPTWKEPMYANGVLCLGNHTHTFEVGDQAAFVLLEALAHPFEEFHENARYLLNFGLSCPHADGRAAAVHAFVSGINYGKLDPRLLGKSMLAFFSSKLIHPARIRKSLDEIVRVSPKHRRAVLNYLTELLRSDPAKAPDNTAKLLELYHELLVEHDERVRDAEVLTYLKAFPGGDRGAKLAKTIAALSK